jgi:hypothetical protein
MQDLTVRLNRKAAGKLAKVMGIILAGSDSTEERNYFMSLRRQLQEFAESPEPIPIKVTVLAIDGVPTGEK